MLNTKEALRGFRDSLPVGVAVAAFGALFGAVAAEKGLSFTEGAFLSAFVFAGASQFTALQFWQEPLPYLTIILVVFAVNFRHILYGAALGRKLGQFSTLQKYLSFFFLSDPTFAMAEKRHEDGLGQVNDVGLTASYYFGAAFWIYPLWVSSSIVGLAFGNLIENPATYGLDFILPIYFLVLLFAFRARANWAYVVVASGLATYLALITLGSPWHISCGALVGILAGALLGAPSGRAAEERVDG